MAKALTYEQVKKYVDEHTDAELLSTEYLGNKGVLRFRCSCGTEFERMWNNFRTGHHKCFRCGTKETYDAKRLSKDDVVERLAEYGCALISGEYKNQTSKLRVVFSCGHEGTLRFNNLAAKSFNGQCPRCRRTECQSLDILQVVLACDMLYGIEVLDNVYVSAHTPMRFRCVCGNEFTACWNNVSNGQTRCRDCTNSISKGEYAVQKWLDDHDIEYVFQKKFADCAGKRPYPFDFFIPELKACIEFDGEQHFRAIAFGGDIARFEELKARDAAKTAYCEAKGYKLIRIKYTEIKNIDDILSSTLIPR